MRPNLIERHALICRMALSQSIPKNAVEFFRCHPNSKSFEVRFKLKFARIFVLPNALCIFRISMKISYFTGKCIPLDQYTCLQRLLLCDFHLSYTLNSIFERIFNNMQLQDFFYLQHAGPVCRYKLQQRNAKKLTLSISFLYSYIAAESY